MSMKYYGLNGNKLFGYPFIVFSLIIYIYFLKINYFPVYLILPYLLFGLFIFVFEVVKNGLRKKYFYYFLLVIISGAWSLVSFVLNIDSDLFYVKENLLLSLILFFLAFSIKKIYKILDVDFNFENIVLFSSLALVFQLIFSLVVNFVPSIFNTTIQIINIDGLSSDTLQNFSEARLVGIGASFFAAGILNSFFLILLAYYINYSKGKKNYFLLLTLFLIISIVGILFSRTTIIGIVLSIFFFLNYKNLFKVVLLIFPLFFLLIIYGKTLSESNAQIAFGLDFLFNTKNSQASSSFNGLKEMYDILPDNLKTWILGDAKYKVVSQNGDFSSYYKETDVGYFRIVFYNGLVGLLLFFFMTFYILKKSFYFSGFLIFVLLLCFFALNLKGVATIYSFCFLFFLVDSALYGDSLRGNMRS